MTQKKRAVVAMSGGVDSSVAAGLLLQQGYEVIGITMRLWTEEDASAQRHHKRCCSVEDTDDARAAADALGIRHYVLNLEREFAEDVVGRFVQEYARGRTPNPCLACNDRVKFRPLLEHAIALGADYLATGHYVRVRHADAEAAATHVAQGPSPERRASAPTTHVAQAPSPERPASVPTTHVAQDPSPERPVELWRAVDPSKDQSYVLYTLRQEELRRTLFPVGDYPKNEVRRLAREWRLPNADKPDSADICFIPSGDYRAFVRERVPVAAGDIVDTSGATVGAHEGIVNYTVGQRRGVPARGNAEPLFVIDIEAGENRVVVGPHEALMAPGLLAEDVTFISGRAPDPGTPVQARIRYRSPAVPASLDVHADGTAEVRFETPQRAVTPGQAVVFYDGERVLGGGTIVSRLQ